MQNSVLLYDLCVNYFPEFSILNMIFFCCAYVSFLFALVWKTGPLLNLTVIFFCLGLLTTKLATFNSFKFSFQLTFIIQVKEEQKLLWNSIQVEYEPPITTLSCLPLLIEIFCRHSTKLLFPFNLKLVLLFVIHYISQWIL